MEWQPIETALKNGSEILVYFKTIGVRQVSWCDDDGEPTGKYAIWRVNDNKHGLYQLRGYSEGDDTHWMPLPPPPTETPKYEIPQMKGMLDMVNALSIRGDKA